MKALPNSAEDRLADVESAVAPADAKYRWLQLWRSLRTSPSHSRGLWLRRSVFAVVLLLVGGALSGVAVATGTDNPNLAFVAVSPAFKVVTNGSVAALKSNSYVVLGASTSVPTDATTVRLSVSVKGTKAGTLSIYPAGNVSDAAPPLTWAAGGTAAATVAANIGSGNKVAFANSSAASATITVTLTGYSTQTAASDISGSGGTIGQVLTNTGAGSAWRNQGQAFVSTVNGPSSITTAVHTAIDHVTVPAGIYVVQDTFSAEAQTGADLVGCYLAPPTGTQAGKTTLDGVNEPYGTPAIWYGAANAQMVLKTNGGAITLYCYALDHPSGTSILNETLTATQVSTAFGPFVTG